MAPFASEQVVVTAVGVAPDDLPRLPDKLVALLHFGRSGTGLLHSLIDGHPEISTLPSIYLRGFFNAGVWRSLAAQGWQALPERFADIFEVLFDATSARITPGMPGETNASLGIKEGMTALGEGRDESLAVDREAFCAEARRLMAHYPSVNPALFLRIVHAAYETALNRDTEKHTTFYHLHNPDSFTMLNFLRHAPDARLVVGGIVPRHALLKLNMGVHTELARRRRRRAYKVGLHRAGDQDGVGLGRLGFAHIELELANFVAAERQARAVVAFDVEPQVAAKRRRQVRHFLDRRRQVGEARPGQFIEPPERRRGARHQSFIRPFSGS